MENNFVVLRDTQEKKGWNWPSLQIKDVSLPTGDYTIEGLETDFIIERKASTSELAQNINQKRFTKELERLAKFKHPFLICEFSFSDVCIFPYNSGIPNYIWPKLKVTANFMIKRVNEIMLDYGIHVIFASNITNAKRIAYDLFKRIIDGGTQA